ncbi:Beta-N-acetylglucosaminidase [Lentibacillus persicus]|uniref:Beta-N-acetylglucosaminidase n=1 Tax=Lentibacillus persicus TaxID=640948 RepID=A0A1I1VSY1_9BACI|nr:S-layer homology domain-containing protein [Lentibacillus persicus]SFD86192.1 Beta-N-acetylglucosaminidase [Lentibacillus persicus]
MTTRFMKTLSAGFLAGVLVLTMPGAVFAEDPSFSDIEKGDSHYEGVMSLAKEGIINGYEDGSFGTFDNVTRQQVAVMLTLALELDIPSDIEQTLGIYDDVNRDSLYAEQIAAVTKAGVFKGSNGQFNPAAEITREQMATVLVLGLELTELESEEDVEVNLDNVSESHVDRVQTFANLGITNQLEDFRPAESLARGQFATFLYKSMKVTGELSHEYIETQFDIDFSDAVNDQTSAKVDGAGDFKATKELVAHYANPSNFNKNDDEFFQFLKLSYEPGLEADELNRDVLRGKGTLEGQGDAFIDAGQELGANVLYLIAHALHETGNGTSALSTGIEVGLNEKGKPNLVTEKNEDNLTDIKTTYNMFGVNAFDDSANESGAKKAYNEGWFSPEEAILGGAEFIVDDYISEGRDTLYKMRWNPQKSWKQYATHVQWATIQARKIKDLYEETGLLDKYTFTFEVPKYQNQPANSPRPYGEDQYAIDETNAGTIYEVDTKGDGDTLNVREWPWGTKTGQYENGIEVEVIGENGNWYKVKADGTTGWVSGDYLVEPTEDEPEEE